MPRWYRLLTIALLSGLLVVGQVNAQSTLPSVTWQKLLDEPVLGASISPDGKYIFYAKETKFNTNFVLYDWRAEKIIWQTSTDVAGIMTSEDWSSWSPNGKYIAILASEVYVLDSKDGSHFSPLETPLKANDDLLRHLIYELGFGYTDLKWNTDSDQLAVMGWGYILVYNLPSGRLKTVVDLSPHFGDGWSLWRFDWSSNDSQFVAFTFKTINYEPVIPAEIVIGFWDKDGRRLHHNEQSETPTTGKKCVRSDVPIQYMQSTDVAWSPDGTQVAVSAGGYTICTLQADGNLSVQEIPDYFPAKVDWSGDQKWLFAITWDCKLLITDLKNNYATHEEPLPTDCISYSSSWSQDHRYVVINGGIDGQWLGVLTNK